MCWVGKNACRIARRDITVYKLGYIYRNKFSSLYRDYDYEIKKINEDVTLRPHKHYSIDGVFRIEDPLYRINEGYHSYTNISISYSNLGLISRRIYLGKIARTIELINDYYIATFIIPEGSNYFENDREEIVSSNIIYTGKYVKL